MIRYLTVLLALVILPCISQADPPFRFPEGKCPHGEMRYINGLPVLTVDGSPKEIGTAVGLLALKPGNRMAGYPDDILRNFHLTLLRGTLLSAGQAMVKRFPDDFRTELEGMAAGSEVKWDNLVLGNTLFDLKKVIACSAIMVEPVRSTTGGTLMGRNLDYPPMGYAQEYTLVTVYRPTAAKHAFATVGFPGLMGCLSGMNDAGLSVAVLEVPLVKLSEKRFDTTGLPYALCYRRLLEECSTIAEAEAMLGQMKRTGLSNLAIADRQGCAVFEITPARVVVRRGQQGTCICTNHFLTDVLRPKTSMNIYGTFDRLAELAKACEGTRKLGPAELQEGLHAAAFSGLTLQTMVFDSASLRLHLACGSIPASSETFKVVDLEPLLRGK
jgi:predicted choloylglycine hydrolase